MKPLPVLALVSRKRGRQSAFQRKQIPGQFAKLILLLLSISILFVSDYSMLKEFPEKMAQGNAVEGYVVDHIFRWPEINKMHALVWQKQKQWLCENRAPNLTAAAQTFHIAQNLFFKNESSILLPQIAMKRFFSYTASNDRYYMERDTNRTVAALRIPKCGTVTVDYYFNNDLRTLGGLVETSDNIDKNFHFQDLRDQDCVIFPYRDPISRFISGYGEIEAFWGWDTPKASYENKFQLPSAERFLGFVAFLLNGEWLQLSNFNNIRLGHVFSFSGQFDRLHSTNKIGITKFLNVQDISTGMSKILKESCGFSIATPEVATRIGHGKVEGLEDLLKHLWRSANNGTVSEDIHRAFQSICLINAVDYACLATELDDALPPICLDAFASYLPNNFDY